MSGLASKCLNNSKTTPIVPELSATNGTVRILKPRPYGCGRYTLAGFRTFITSALRGARWAPRYEVIRQAYVRDGINPATGRKCKLHECVSCKGLFPQNQMQADHIEPVVPVNNDWAAKPDSFLGYDWNDYVRRLFCELIGLQAICKPCHKTKSKIEQANRRL